MERNPCTIPSGRLKSMCPIFLSGKSLGRNAAIKENPFRLNQSGFKF